MSDIVERSGDTALWDKLDKIADATHATQLSVERLGGDVRVAYTELNGKFIEIAGKVALMDSETATAHKAFAERLSALESARTFNMGQKALLTMVGGAIIAILDLASHFIAHK